MTFGLVHIHCTYTLWRRGALMASALLPGSSIPGSSPVRGYCCVLEQDT